MDNFFSKLDQKSPAGHGFFETLFTMLNTVSVLNTSGSEYNKITAEDARYYT